MGKHAVIKLRGLNPLIRTHLARPGGGGANRRKRYYRAISAVIYRDLGYLFPSRTENTLYRRLTREEKAWQRLAASTGKLSKPYHPRARHARIRVWEARTPKPRYRWGKGVFR